MKSLKIGLALASSVALVALTATPALAALRSLPAGDTLYAFECDSTMPDVASVDVATGALTEVVADSGDHCFAGGAFNSVDGLFYVPDFNDEHLYSFDPVANTLTDEGAISTCVGLYAMSIDASGNGFYVDDNYDFWTFNVSTATCTTKLGNLGDSFYAIAFNPIDGKLYGANYGDGTFGIISTVDATYTPLPNSTMGSGDNAGLTFDSSGIAWIIDEVNNAELFSAPIDNYDGAAENQGQLTFSSADVYSESIAINTTFAPAPELPNTGSDSGVALALAIGSGVVVACGVVLTTLRRRAI